MTRPLFHYDLNCPWSWIAAERISGAFNEAGAELPEWRPIAGSRLTRGAEHRPDPDQTRTGVLKRATELGLAEPRFPAGWPDETDSETALLGVLYAAEAGRVIAVSLAAFRQQFAAGRSLADPDNVMIAAASCELHPKAVSKGIESRAIAKRLDENHREAEALGVAMTPTVSVGGELFEGEESIEAAVLANLDASQAQRER